MLRRTLEEIRHVFRGEEGDQNPLAFVYRRPTAGAWADYQDEILRPARISGGNGKPADLSNAVMGISRAELRLAFNCLVRWEGYLDEKGDSVPLSFEAFEAFPAVKMREFLLEFADVYASVPEDERKNSGRPSGRS